MKNTRRLLAAFLAAAMAATMMSTMVSAATYDYTNITGENSLQLAASQIYDANGKAVGENNIILPDSTYYVIIGESAIYDNLMAYQKQVTVKVTKVAGNQMIVPTSTVMVEKVIGGTRYTAVQFKTNKDYSSDETAVKLNIKITAKANLALAVEAGKFPMITGTNSSAVVVPESNAANTQTLATAQKMYTLSKEHQTRLAALNKDLKALVAAAPGIEIGTNATARNAADGGAADASAFTDAQRKEALRLRDTATTLVMDMAKAWNTYKGVNYTGTVSVQNLLDVVYDNYATLNPTKSDVSGATATSLAGILSSEGAGASGTADSYKDATAASMLAILNGIYNPASGLTLTTGAVPTMESELAAYIKSLNGTAVIGGATFLNTGDVLNIPVKFYVQNTVVSGSDTVFTVGQGGLVVKPVSGENNTITWEDKEGTIATLRFHADTSGSKFYTKLTTNWSNEWYRQYFAHSDAFIYKFEGDPNIPTTSRAQLQLSNPFIDEYGVETIDPLTVSIYRVNEEDGTIEDLSEFFSYVRDENGDMVYEGSTRVLGTYIISEREADLPEDIEVVEEPDTSVKKPANTGR